jgi:hypothetical protein
MSNTNNLPITFEPVFTKKQVSEFEEKYNSEWGTKRRLLMLTLSRSSDELLAAFDEDEGIEGITALMEQILDYEGHLTAGLELVESAKARLFAVANQLDMLEPTDTNHE